VTARVGAILLAAGLSQRMGTCKQLLPLGEKTVIAHCLEGLLAGGAEEVIVVVGPQGGAVAEEVEDYPLTVVRTAIPHGDMAASALFGRDALSPGISGVLVALCDHPLVAPTTLRLLAAHHAEKPDSIIIPLHEGRKGHPALFPRHVLDELDGSRTLRDVVRATPDRVCLVEVCDPGVLLDMDTPEEYLKVTAFYRERAGQPAGDANPFA
jgi:molybdenum cofactor cytidylyltransferase